jgi:hypothetical protein
MKKILLSILSLFILNTYAQLPASPLAIYEFTSGSLANTAGTSATDFNGSILSISDRNSSNGDAADITGELIGANLGGNNINNTTLSFWIRNSALSTGTIQRVLQITGTNRRGYFVEIYQNGIWVLYEFETTTGGVASYFSQSDPNTYLNDNTWYNITIRTNELITSSSNEIHTDLFINGILSTSCTYASSGDQIANFIKNGVLIVDSLNEYEGDIDDIYLYDRSLSDVEISELAYYYPLTSSISNNKRPYSIIASPNPSDGVVTFSTSEAISSIEVYNLIGENVIHLSNVNSIDISNLPNGIYIAIVNSKSGKTTKKKLVKY